MTWKTVYWGSTGLLALFVLFSGTMYFVAEAPAKTFAQLGFPDYFRVQLGVAKILGGVALLVPLPRWLKEWTYAGFTINFVSAFIALMAAGAPASSLIAPTTAFLVLMTSYAAYRRAVVGADAPNTSGPRQEAA